MTRQRSDLLACVGLGLLWLLPAAWIGVGGEFPLLDDWAYARTTRTWLETGRFERTAYTYSTIVTNVGLGALFSWGLGFSFEALRWSSLATGGFGALASYALCRELGAKPVPAGAAALLVAFNPVHLLLAYTFMTDVAFSAFVTASLAALVRGLRLRHVGWIAVGLVLAAIATMSRQTGLALPLALVAAVLASWIHRPRVWIPVVAAAAAVAALYAFAPALFFGDADAGAQGALRYYLADVLFGPRAFYFAARNALSTFAYLGLFLAPAALAFAPGGARGRALAAASAASACVGTATLAFAGNPMPLGINLVYDLGLGHLTVAGKQALPSAPGFWWGVTWIALAGGSLVTGRIALEIWDRRQRLLAEPAWLLPLLFAGVHLGVLIVRWPFFDRWLLPLLPALAAVLVTSARGTSPGRPARLAAALLGVGLAVYGILGTRDFLDHHRARWSLLRPLLESGVAPGRIDGGKEFNALYTYAIDETRFLERGPRQWVVDDEYLISLAEQVPGYRVVDSRRYPRFLPPGEASVTLHRRIAPAARSDPDLELDSRTGESGGSESDVGD